MILAIPILAGLVGGVLVARIGRMARRTAARVNQVSATTYRGPIAAGGNCGCRR